jgi:hypothetical protein
VNNILNTAAWKPPFSYVTDADFDRHDRMLEKKRKEREAALGKKQEFEAALQKRKNLVSKEIQKAKDEYAEELLEIYEMKDKIEAELRKQKARVVRNDKVNMHRDKLAAIEQEMVEYVKDHAGMWEEADNGSAMVVA